MDRGVDQGPWLQERVGGGMACRVGGTTGAGLVDGGGVEFLVCDAQKKEKCRFLKDALWGAHRSWPGG